jgi:hypothetical protein
MTIELAADPVLTDDEIRDAFAETASRNQGFGSSFVLTVGRALEQAVLAKLQQGTAGVQNAPGYRCEAIRCTCKPSQMLTCKRFVPVGVPLSMDSAAKPRESESLGKDGVQTPDGEQHGS